MVATRVVGQQRGVPGLLATWAGGGGGCGVPVARSSQVRWMARPGLLDWANGPAGRHQAC